MNITIRLILALSFFLLITGIQAQNRRLNAADEDFRNKKYSLAMEKYRKAYSKTKNRSTRETISFKIAECERMKGDVRRTKNAYKRLISMDYQEKEPIVLLHYAEACLKDNRLELAKTNFEEYLKKVPDDPQALRGLKSVEFIEEHKETKGRYEVERERKINSRFDEFSPTYMNSTLNEIAFTSNRDDAIGKKEDEWTGKKFTDIFVSRQDKKGKWSTPVLLDEEEIVNTEANEGQPMMNKHFNLMYFTRCSKLDRRAAGCKVYTAKRQGMSWQEPKELNLGGDTLSAIGHPTLSEDETIIIFAADFDDSKGGKDLYIASRSSRNGDFDPAVNLGDAVNTYGDELFPFLRGDTALYFASNGHVGMGGLDIYKTVLSRDEEGKFSFSEPVNMLPPINSNADDFGIVFSPQEEGAAGFFASNRKSNQGDDIYTFTREPLLFTLSGTITDDRTLQKLPEVNVMVTGSDGTQLEDITDENGYYSFNKNQIFGNITYEIAVSKEGYFNQNATETTVGLQNSTDLVRDFVLVPIPQEPIMLPEILYDLGKWDLKPQYQDSLQGLITIMQENPNLIIELAAHTDMRDSDENNDKLSQKRAQSVVDYLIDRGIDAGRLSAKGYGERVPLELKKDVTKDGFLFPQGTVLNEEYINKLESRVEREIAHQMNRRTEFSIIGTDYIPGSGVLKTEGGKIDIVTAPEKNEVRFTYSTDGNQIVAPCIINGISAKFIYDLRNIKNAVISEEAALELLKSGAISKTDFLGDISRALGDGWIENNARFIINDMRIGKELKYDVEVVVNRREKGQYLKLPKAVLNKFGTVKLDKENQKIIFE